MTSPNRKLVYHVATSLDGFLACSDDTYGPFPQEGDHIVDYFATLQSDYDTIIMGRRTYEVGLRLGVTDPYPFLQTYVLSRSLPEADYGPVRIVREGWRELVGELKQTPGKPICLGGGGELASSLLNEGLVDELLIKLNPLLLGVGKPLDPRLAAPQALTLLDTKRYQSGVLLLRYGVVQAS